MSMTKTARRALVSAVVGFGLAIVAATAKTKIESAPESKQPPEGRPKKILVLAVSPDPSIRSGFEDAITGELTLRGANAVSSFVSFPELPKSKEEFEKTLISDGFDAVTVSRLVGRDDKLQWTPSSQEYQADYIGMGPWGGYWYTYQLVMVPAYLDAETSVRVRTDLWRTSGTTGKLVWSGTTDTIEPTSVPQAAHEIGVAVAKALQKAKLI
jgi:hypothetical protein